MLKWNEDAISSSMQRHLEEVSGKHSETLSVSARKNGKFRDTIGECKERLSKQSCSSIFPLSNIVLMWSL